MQNFRKIQWIDNENSWNGRKHGRRWMLRSPFSLKTGDKKWIVGKLHEKVSFPSSMIQKRKTVKMCNTIDEGEFWSIFFWKNLSPIFTFPPPVLLINGNGVQCGRSLNEVRQLNKRKKWGTWEYYVEIFYIFDPFLEQLRIYIKCYGPKSVIWNKNDIVRNFCLYRPVGRE